VGYTPVISLLSRTTLPSLTPTLKGYKILLAEDGLDNQRLIRCFLHKAGAEVEVVGNGEQALEAIHRRKTGAMFLAPLQLGALTAGARDNQLAALREYGECLGLAFQIVDDLLDVQGNEATLGKRVGKDVAHGKLTFPGLLGIAESRHRAAQLTAQACAAVAPMLPAAEGLDALARFVAERDR